MEGPYDDYPDIEKYEWYWRKKGYWRLVQIIPEAGIWREFRLMDEDQRWHLYQCHAGVEEHRLWAAGERIVDRISGGIFDEMH
tara:strand:- start:27389 stop:27637 length:249 start_codon:yes stop_codon:yes gene_type:complete